MGPPKDHKKEENLKEDILNLFCTKSFLMSLGMELKMVKELQLRPTLTM